MSGDILDSQPDPGPIPMDDFYKDEEIHPSIRAAVYWSGRLPNLIDPSKANSQISSTSPTKAAARSFFRRNGWKTPQTGDDPTARPVPLDDYQDPGTDGSPRTKVQKSQPSRQGAAKSFGGILSGIKNGIPTLLGFAPYAPDEEAVNRLGVLIGAGLNNKIGPTLAQAAPGAERSQEYLSGLLSVGVAWAQCIDALGLAGLVASPIAGAVIATIEFRETCSRLVMSWNSHGSTEEEAPAEE